MSDALSPNAPEPFSAAPEVSDPAPVSVTAAADGSAGTSDVVEATRFNGLMAAHQRTLADLEAERQARAALEARVNSQETTTVADEQALDEVRQLREELRQERLEAAKAKALVKYPEAAPLADLIVGGTAQEIETVAKAVADRLKTMTPAPTTDPVVTEPVVAAPAPTAPVVPVIGGPAATPAVPTGQATVADALAKGSWADFWSAKAGAKAQANLG